MEFRNDQPIYLQVINDIKAKILSGEIEPGQKLPSSRELAVLYQVNPNTASRIYGELERQGVTYTKRGIGTFVKEDTEMKKQMREEAVETVVMDFLQKMKKMGYTEKEMIALLKKHAQM
jgi:GntR family transcriptional regulator